MEVLPFAAFAPQTPQITAPAAEGTTASTGVPPAPGDGQGARQPGWADSVMSFVPFLLIIAIFYFVMIGPERKQRKKREAMLAAVKKGDKVLTTGGMYASVAAVSEDTITLQAADEVRLRFSRAAIAQVLETDGAETSAKS